MYPQRRFFSLSSCSIMLLFSCIAAWREVFPQELAIPSRAIEKQFFVDRQKNQQNDSSELLAHDPLQSNSGNGENSKALLPSIVHFPSYLENSSETPFQTFSMILQPDLEISPLPKWMQTPPLLNKEAGFLELTIPALAQESEIENLALTINFNDQGDGGPLLEIKKKGDAHFTLFCSGLGINGPPLGLNSRTVAIPAELALDGGIIKIEYQGRFQQIHSLFLRPGYTAALAVLSNHFFPAIMDESTVIEREEAQGAAPLLKKGDLLDHRITYAELSASIEELKGSVEFKFDFGELPQATLLRTEIQGLDLESHIDVELNGKAVGPLNIASFTLDSPEFIAGADQHLGESSPCVAGWRKAYCYIPSSLWREKENHLLLLMKPGVQSPESQVHLKNSSLEVLSE